MIYVFDIDGTICTNTNGEYSASEPLKERIDIVNGLYEKGHTIIMLTARGMSRSKGVQEKADSLMRQITESQLKKWGVKFHQLYFGKPFGDYYIDDKAIKDEDFFNE